MVDDKQSLLDNFNFALVGAGGKLPFQSYVSSIDPTTASPGVLIQGSQNTLIPIKGNPLNRPGLKLRGAGNGTISGTVSSYEWNSSLGATRVLRVNGLGPTAKLQVEFNKGDGSGYIWYDLIQNLALTRFVFDSWYNNSFKKDGLLMVKGDTVVHYWSGGIAVVAAVSNANGFISAIDEPGTSPSDDSGGVGYVVGDILGITGGAATLYVDAVSPGGVATALPSTMTSIGTGYLVNDIVAIPSQNNGAAAYFKVTSISGPGGITGISILSSGNGYVPSVNNVVAGGTGTGAHIDVFAVGNSITKWHVLTNGSGYSTGVNVVLTGGTGTGANLHITATANAAITVAGQQPLAQLGFEGTNNITIGGVTYQYTAVTGQSFIGIAVDPSSIPVGSVILQAIQTTNNLPDKTNLNFTNDFIKVINNQLHVGCYKSNLVYVSSGSDYTNFEISLPRVPNSPDLIVLDSPGRGITTQRSTNTLYPSTPVISGGIGDWYTISYQQTTVALLDGSGNTITVENATRVKSENTDLATALAHEFITNVGDDIVFVDQNNQLREYGTVRNFTNPTFPLLSLDVYKELQGLDLTGGHCRAVAGEDAETVYITCPKTGTDYMYQIRQRLNDVGNMVAERIWQPPQIRGLSRIAVINGVTYGHSATNPQLFQLWETGQYYDDAPDGTDLPYECHAIFAYLNIGRTQQLFFDKIFIEGYMTPGTPLMCTVLMEYQGSKFNPTFIINSPGKGQNVPRFYEIATQGSLGDESLGDTPLGDGLTLSGANDESTPKFRCIRAVTPQDIFEYALDVWSNFPSAQWELVTLGANHMSTGRQPVSITTVSTRG